MDKIAQLSHAVQSWEHGRWRAQPSEATELIGGVWYVLGARMTAAEKPLGASE